MWPFFIGVQIQLTLHVEGILVFFLGIFNELRGSFTFYKPTHMTGYLPLILIMWLFLAKNTFISTAFQWWKKVLYLSCEKEILHSKSKYRNISKIYLKYHKYKYWFCREMAPAADIQCILICYIIRLQLWHLTVVSRRDGASFNHLMYTIRGFCPVTR